MPAALFNQSLYSPAKMSAAGAENLLAIDQYNATRAAGGGYMVPDMGMVAPTAPTVAPGVAQAPLVNRNTGGLPPPQPPTQAQASAAQTQQLPPTPRPVAVSTMTTPVQDVGNFAKRSWLGYEAIANAPIKAVTAPVRKYAPRVWDWANTPR